MTRELRDLIAQLADELERLSDFACIYGQFQTCTKNADCVCRRQLIATARHQAPAWLDAVDQLRIDHPQVSNVPELRRKSA